ncbi:hypothetical protein CRG98_003439 [Punica granatum]|uniref:Uncharacterized protein n=1 Tax=Punica granatum TaxID=22663 RepID=A0A2I0L5V6_PUNGR|nr:hypothetical protein CRG98_003439 [Punica granatum]
MAVKLSPLASPKKIHPWVNLFARLSSIPCPVDVESPQQTRHSSPTGSDYESNIKSSRGKLVPDNLIRVLGSTGDIESLVRIFKWAAVQERFQHTAGTYCVMILKLGLAGNVKEMEGFCQNMIKDRCPGAEDALVSLVEKFLEHGRMNAAIRVLASMTAEGFKPSAELFNALLGALVAEKGELKDVIFVYKEMALIEAGWIDSALDQYRRINKKGWLCGHFKLKQALQVLGKMVVASLIPDSSTHSALILGYSKLGLHDDAIKLFERVCARCWVLDPLSHSELIKSLCEIGRTLEAAEVFRYMSVKKHPLESCSFNMLMKAVFDTRGIHEAREMLTLAAECGVSFSDETYTIMLDGLSEKPKYQLIVLAQMVVRGFGISREAYAILIRGAASSLSRANEAALLFNLMVAEEMIPESESLLDLLSIFAGRSQLHKISCSIDKLLSTHGVLNSDMYSLLINGLWKEGDKSKARDLLDLMLEKGWVPDKTSPVPLSSNQQLADGVGVDPTIMIDQVISGKGC